MKEAVYSSPNRNAIKAKVSQQTLPHSAIPVFPLSVSLCVLTEILMLGT